MRERDSAFAYNAREFAHCPDWHCSFKLSLSGHKESDKCHFRELPEGRGTPEEKAILHRRHLESIRVSPVPLSLDTQLVLF